MNKVEEYSEAFPVPGPFHGQILEFLEICIHHLLFLHKIYPAGIFSRKQRYGIAIQISNHPEVNAYITNCLQTAHKLLKSRDLEKLILIFLKPDQSPIKKFTFDIAKLKTFPDSDRESKMQLELSLRDALLKLSICDRKLSPIPENCTFKILLCTTEESYLNLCQGSGSSTSKEHYDFPWVQSEVRTTGFQFDDLVPVALVDSPYSNLQIFAHEVKGSSGDSEGPNCNVKSQNSSEPEFSILSQEY